MKQEEKDLLLKDLCARLPYNNLKVRGVFFNYNKDINRCQYEECDREFKYDDLKHYESLKPYLLPLSSMTDEMWDKEFREYGITEFTRDSFKYGCETLEFHDSNSNLSNTINFINKLLKNHFDIYGLIPMGLAIDATGLKIY